MLSLSVGSTLQNGKYEIIRILGQGGFGITYLAVHTLLDKNVAIKEFFPKDFCDRNCDTNHITLGTSSSADLVSKLKKKFIKEAKNIAKLSHPHIVPIQDIFEENNTAYYLMDYIEGKSLGEIIKSEGAISEARAVRYISQVSSAIDYIHSKKMNHLDIKPGNIMISTKDDSPVLIDFGTSKQYDVEGEQTSTMAPGFTHGYAPIEQYKPGGVASFSPQTDIYALGATLYALVTGKKPPHYSEIIEDGLPELPENLSESTKNAIAHAMEFRKNNRPSSISEFVQYFNPKSDNSARLIIEESIINPAPQSTNPQKTQEREEDTIFAEPEKELSNSKIAHQSTENNSTVIEGIEFVDLGLSVLWANMNIGATQVNDSGTFVNKLDSSSTNLVAEFNLKGAKIPTIGHFMELRNQCHWQLTELNGVFGYSVKGKNGNRIFLPLCGGENNGEFTTFVRLFTRETFYNSHNTGGYYFYYNLNGEYKVIQYSCDFKCPVRMIL